MTEWNLSEDEKRIAEDDVLRSAYVRKLVEGRLRRSARSSSQTCTPKRIVQFWDEPKAIPADVHACLDSWCAVESDDFGVELFDKEGARKFISCNYPAESVEAYGKCYHPAMQSDFFRLCYIYARGGCYVDADDEYTGAKIDHLFVDGMLKLQPLCYDCESGVMVEPDKFMDPSENSDHWIYYFNNNPIIAGAGHPIIGQALHRATRLLLGSSESHPEIQSTTGPGNLTASVVARSIATGTGVTVLGDWAVYARTVWALSYRSDTRNWRHSNSKRFQRHESL